MIHHRNALTGTAGLVVACLVAVLAAGCDGETSTGPTRTDLTGTWTGTSTYPNAPFELRLTQSGDTLRGSYRDGHDTSLAVTGTFSNEIVAIVVDFGDAKLNLDGRLANPRSVHGMMHTSALGPKQFPFTMTR